MAYFRVTQKQSGGGSGATITVTYTSSYYSKTITCSDGVTTYTATTTSAGSTTFTVNDEGTWTITCDGTSKTVNVVLAYTTALSITKTITVYSAANDTVSFTDDAGSKTVATDSTGAGSASMTLNYGDSITFTSSVAKNPSDLSSYYSKTVVIDASTTAVYLMPNNCLYWYGWDSGDLQEMSTSNGWAKVGNRNWVSPSNNTNDITIASGSSTNSGIATKTTKNIATLHAILKATFSGSNGNEIVATPNKSWNSFPIDDYNRSNNTLIHQQASASNGDYYLVVYCGVSISCVLNAFWYE